LRSNQIPRQNSAIECNQSLAIGTTSLISGEDPKSDTEEVICGKGFGMFYKLREVFTVVSRSFEKRFKLKILEQSLVDSHRFRLDDLVCGCEAQTIDQPSAPNGPDVAAEDDNLNSNQIPKQSLAIECNQNLEVGNTCLTSEIDLKIPVERISIVDESRSLKRLKEYQRDKARYEAVCKKQSFQKPAEILYLDDSYNPDVFTHADTVGLEAREFTFMHGEACFTLG
jgi:hypothetical protein